MMNSLWGPDDRDVIAMAWLQREQGTNAHRRPQTWQELSNMKRGWGWGGYGSRNRQEISIPLLLVLLLFKKFK